MLNIKTILLLLLFLSCSEKSDLIFNPDNGLFNSSLNFKGTNETLDIITWNIENYPKNDLTNTYISQIIDSLDVDIIALQEIADNVSFNDLVNSLEGWSGYRSGGSGSDYQELAYLINTNKVEILSDPYTILNSYQYEFAYREPLVLECLYNNNHVIIINNHFKCCGDGLMDLNDDSDEETRRYIASNLLNAYINNNFPNKNVIVLGDFNDSLIDNVTNNIFQMIIDDYENYLFTDIDIADGSSAEWSFPNWPSHLDHILITNELFNNVISTNTVLIDYSLSGGFSTYDNYVSDHRPVGIKLLLNP